MHNNIHELKMNFEACEDGKGAWVVSNKGPDPHWTLDDKEY